jgi:hypothetical protein
MTGRASRPQDWGFQHSNLGTGAFSQIGLGPLLAAYPCLVATTTRLRDHAACRLISGRILNGRVEIPIEPPPALRPTS